jgi:hypothetical protein
MEQNVERRIPWATLAIVGLLVGVAVLVWLGSGASILGPSSEARRTAQILRHFEEDSAHLEKRLRNLNIRLETARPPLAPYADDVDRDLLPEWNRLRSLVESAPNKAGLPDAEYLQLARRYILGMIRLLEEFSAALRSEDTARVIAIKDLAKDAAQRRQDIIVLTARRNRDRE